MATLGIAALDRVEIWRLRAMAGDMSNDDLADWGRDILAAGDAVSAALAAVLEMPGPPTPGQITQGRTLLATYDDILRDGAALVARFRAARQRSTEGEA